MSARLFPSAVFLCFAAVQACSVAYVAPPQPEFMASESDDSALSADDSGGAGTDTADSSIDSATNGETEPACASYAEPEQSGTVADAALNEISGLAASRKNPGVLWVLEDHLAPNEVVAIDLGGHTLGRVVLDGTVNNDWEDLAVGPCGEEQCLFVGEIGDNNHDREWHGVYRFVEPEVDLAGGLDVTVAPELFQFVYPDGNYDAEAMTILPDGRPMVLTKEYDTDQSTAYSFENLNPFTTATLVRHGRFFTGSGDEGGAAAVTGASLWADGRTLLVRTYGHVWSYALSSSDTAGLDALDTAIRVELTTGSERQGESITFDPHSKGYFTISEDVNPPVWFNDCAEGE